MQGRKAGSSRINWIHDDAKEMRGIFTAWNLFLHNLDTSELWNWTLSCHGLFASELSSFELQILELFELLELLELVQEETRAHCDLERKLWCRDTKTWKNVEHIILPGQTSHPPLCSMAWKTLRPCSEDCSTYQVCSVKKKFIQSCIVFTVCTSCVFYEYNQTTCLFISIIHIPFYILCSISSTVKLSRLPLTSFRKPCCLRLSISGDSWEAKVWDQHDQRKGRITSGSCGWKRFTDCSIPYALSRDHQPSDINSVPTCPKQNWSTTSTTLTTLTTRISVPFLPFLPSPTPLCLPASNSAWRFGQKAKHLPWPPKTRKIWSEAISKILTKPYDRHAFLEPEIIWIIYESWASNDIGTLCHTSRNEKQEPRLQSWKQLSCAPIVGQKISNSLAVEPRIQKPQRSHKIENS